LPGNEHITVCREISIDVAVGYAAETIRIDTLCGSWAHGNERQDDYQNQDQRLNNTRIFLEE
jgi:hypothetical protein